MYIEKRPIMFGGGIFRIGLQHEDQHEFFMFCSTVQHIYIYSLIAEIILMIRGLYIVRIYQI